MIDTEQLIEYLAGTASLRQRVTYNECLNALTITDLSILFGLLGRVQRMQARLGCDLSALVVSSRTGRPGTGWARGATEDWDSAVARCYTIYAEDTAQTAASSSGQERPALTHGLPYDPGNAGDLLKHTWLAAIVPWLIERSPSLFRYADSFAGNWEYELTPPVEERVSRLRGTELARYSRTAWDRRRYLGSTGLVGAITTTEQCCAEIWVGDRDHERVSRLVAEHGCRELPESSDGYGVLEGSEGYHLLLLDPFAEFLDRAHELLPKIAARSRTCSVLLFVLAGSRKSPAYERHTQVLREQCRAHDTVAVAGCLPPVAGTAVRGETKHFSEVVFLPQRDLARPAVDRLLPALASSTVRVATAIGDGVEACLRLEGLCPEVPMGPSYSNAAEET